VMGRYIHITHCKQKSKASVPLPSSLPSFFLSMLLLLPLFLRLPSPPLPFLFLSSLSYSSLLLTTSPSLPLSISFSPSYLYEEAGTIQRSNRRNLHTNRISTSLPLFSFSYSEHHRQILRLISKNSSCRTEEENAIDKEADGNSERREDDTPNTRLVYPIAFLWSVTVLKRENECSSSHSLLTLSLSRSRFLLFLVFLFFFLILLSLPYSSLIFCSSLVLSLSLYRSSVVREPNDHEDDNKDVQDDVEEHEADLHQTKDFGGLLFGTKLLVIVGRPRS